MSQPTNNHTTNREENIESYDLLNRINNVADLRNLSKSELPRLCGQIRRYIIDNCSSNPGHFASSMGAVEIIVAIHYVFSTPEDHLVFDVGHQAYAHKILTGRRDKFRSQRTLGGISGFPFPTESQYDTFVAGHAGNSISAALGMAVADMNTPGNENRHTVALIGDASISNGLAFEGLNNVSNNPNNLLIILNDNEMSIDDNVGALHRYLMKVNTSKEYNHWRHKTYNFLKNKKLITEPGRRQILRFNNSLKSLISNQQNIFEGLNIRYMGPTDGHDVIELVRVLEEIKDMKGPRLLHIHTTKGKGFAEAEKDPTTWHAPGKFDPATGKREKKTQPAPRWQDVFGRHLVEMSDIYPEIVGVTAAMPSGTSMSLLLKTKPDRAYDVGISEGHAVTFAGGMASAGKHPFVAIYSSFLQRAYDNIIHDVAIQKLPVTFCIDRAGIVGEDGVTHHGLLDIAYLRCIPNMHIAVPSDAMMLSSLMNLSMKYDGPTAIRYPRGNVPTESIGKQNRTLQIGKAESVITNPKSRIAVLSVGPELYEAKEAVEMLKDEDIYVDLYDMIWVKPLDTDLLDEIATKYDAVLTVEDGTVEGGFGSAVAQYLCQKKNHPQILLSGVDDKFITHGKVAELKKICKLTKEDIVEKIKGIEQSNR